MPELNYYAIYRKGRSWMDGHPPVNLVVDFLGQMEGLGYHAMLWDHQRKDWVYNPEAVSNLFARQMDAFEEEERRRDIDRAEAEQIALQLSEGQKPLPTEQDIFGLFNQYIPMTEQEKIWDEWDREQVRMMLEAYEHRAARQQQTGSQAIPPDQKQTDRQTPEG